MLINNKHYVNFSIIQKGDTKLEKYFSYKDGKPEVQKLLFTMLTNNISLIMKRIRAFFIKQLYQHGDLFFSDRKCVYSTYFQL